MSLRLTVLGLGYLGTAQAACLASLGFTVLGVDTDPQRVHTLSQGTVPFFEPDLEPLLQAGLRSGRLSFTTDYAKAAAFGDVHFVCVGTPQAAGSDRADLTQLDTCVILCRYEVDRVVGRRDLQNDVWVSACELSQFRQDHHLCRGSRDDESNSACWTLSLFSGFSYSSLDPL